MKSLANFRLAPLIVGLTTLVALTTPSAHADTMSLDSPGALLTLTENSSTSLTYTYTGASTVSITPNSGGDNWTVTLTGSCTFTIPMSADWLEPENNLQANRVSTTSSNTLSVLSDVALLSYYGGTTLGPFNDGMIVPGWGTDNGVPISIKFVDMAAQAESGTGVPDGGSTVALLAVSGAGLFGLMRLRRFQLA